MESQPFIFKKQIYACIILMLMLYFFLAIMRQSIPSIFIFLVAVQNAIFTITFLPYIFHFMKYPLWLHTILYHLPFFSVVVFVPFIRPHYNLILILISVVLILLLVLFLGHKEFVNSLKSIESKMPLKFGEFWKELLKKLYAIVSEELFFRAFLISIAQDILGLYCILFASLLFTYFHYLNRWSDRIFTLKIYFLQFCLGIIGGITFYFTHSIVICILYHLLFNCSDFIILFKRLRVEQVELFD